jgi:hypothetical protein
MAAFIEETRTLDHRNPQRLMTMSRLDGEDIMMEKNEQWFDKPLGCTGLGIGFWLLLFVLPDFARGFALAVWHTKLIGPADTSHIYYAAIALAFLFACWATGLPSKRIAGLFACMVAALVAALAGSWIWPSYGGTVALSMAILVIVLVTKFRRSEWWP